MSGADFNRLLFRYVAGFISALALSVGAYFVATSHVLSNPRVAMVCLLLLGFLQLLVQLVCFLHLGLKGRSSSRTLAFAFTGIMMLVIVVGSIWIMKNLDYHMSMSGHDMFEYMQGQNEKGF